MTRADYYRVMDRLREMVNTLDSNPEDVEGLEMWNLLDSVDEYISHLDVELDDAKENLAIAEVAADEYRTGAYLSTALDDPWIRDKVRRGIDRAASGDPMGAWDAGMRELIGTEVHL